MFLPLVLGMQVDISTWAWSPLVEGDEQPYQSHQKATQSMKLIFFASA